MSTTVNISFDLDPNLFDNTTDDHGCDEDWAWNRLDRSLLTALSALIIMIGTTGNTIAYFVLIQKSYKNNVMASALRYLAIMDNIILWTIVLELFCKSMIGFELSLLSSTLCILFHFYTLMMTSFDNWLLVTITLTRLIHLMCPFKTQVICSKFNYYSLTILINLIVVGVHGGVTISILSRGNLSQKHKYYSCYVISSRAEAENMFHLIANVTINVLAPGCLLLAFNCMIGQELTKMEEREKMLKNRPHVQFDETSVKREDVELEKGSEFTSKTTNSSTNAMAYELERSTVMTALKVDRGENDAICSSRQLPNVLDKIYSTDESQEEGNVDFEGVFSNDWLLLEEDRFRRHPIRRGLCLKKSGYKCVDKTWVIQNFFKKGADASQNAKSPTLTTAASDLLSSDGTKITAITMSNISVKSQAPGILPNAEIRVLADHEKAVKRQSNTSLRTTPSKNVDSPQSSSRGAWGTLHRVSFVLKQPINLDSESWPSSSDNQDQRDVSYRERVFGQIGTDRTYDPGNASPYSPDLNKGVTSVKKDSRIQSLTRLLMMASSVFLIVNMPYWTYHLFAKSWRSDGDPGCAYRRFVTHLLLLLRYSNHSLNFFFYCASGSRFRREFFNWWQSLSLRWI